MLKGSLGFPGLALMCLSALLISCGGGGGGDTSSGGGGGSPPGNVVLSAQLQNVSNWEVYQGKDNTNSNVLASMPFLQKALIAINSLISALSSNSSALDLSGVTTYTTTGILGEVLRFLYVDDDLLITGDLESGYSAINLSNLASPKGKIRNYRGSAANNARWGTIGFQGAAKRETDGIIYAWYGTDIVRVDTSTVVYSAAPYFQGSIYSVYATDRIFFDASGDLWIGAVNLQADGTPNNSSPNSNGLYRIDSSFSSMTQLLDDTVAVWNLFRDSQNVIWASTNKGVYRIVPGQSPANVFDGSGQTKYSGQIIEHSGNIYSLVRNYFHNPNELGSNLVFELYQWNGATFAKIGDIYTGYPFWNSAFIWQGNLYVTRQGTGTLRFNGVDGFDPVTIGGTGIEGVLAKASGDVIASVLNISGISIYNYQNGGETIKLTAANTAEGLIRNWLHSLFWDTDGKLYIGPDASGFNILSNGNFEGYEIPNEIIVAGFFKYNNRMYVSTAVNTYYLEDNQTHLFSHLNTNGARIYHDGDHLWAIVDTGAGDGALSLLDLSTQQKIENIPFDQGYHFYDVVSAPGEQAVFIGVGKNLPPDYQGETLPYVIKYHYGTGSFEKVSLPDPASTGIFKFGSSGSTVYGVGNGKLFAYENGVWSVHCDTPLYGSITAVKCISHYLFVTSDGRGGLTVLDLNSRTSEEFTTQNVALPSNWVNDMAVEPLGSDRYKLWFATDNGLASCFVEIPSE
jgi:hypothetical protein